MIEHTIAIEPIVGYRAFSIDMFGKWDSIGIGRFAYDQYAPGNKYQAVHAVALGIGTHKPFAECQCGFYAWKSMELALKQDVGQGLFYIGPVLLSGVVVEHELGFRASEMTVLQYEFAAQSWRYWLRKHEDESCPDLTYLYECPHVFQRGVLTMRYSRVEWEEAIKNDPWPEAQPWQGERLYQGLFSQRLEIDFERLQSESSE